MSRLSDKSLVKRFAKGAAVTVDLGGTPENSGVNEKLRASILRDPEKKMTEAERVSSHLSEAMLHREM